MTSRLPWIGWLLSSAFVLGCVAQDEDAGLAANEVNEVTALPSLDFASFDLPAVKDDVPCDEEADTGPTAIARVAFAQTHLMETRWPFFALTAGRPAAIHVDVTGSGSASSVKVTAQRGGEMLGSLCLAPGVAPTFHATMPAEWLVPGASLVVTAGKARRELPASELKVGIAPVFTLVTADVLLFGDTRPAPREEVDREFIARVPIARLQHGHFPLPLALPRLVVGPRQDGNDGSGGTVPQPAMWADARPSCTSAQKAAGACTRYHGRGVIATVRSLGEAILRANGLTTSAIMYAALGEGSTMGGGLAGGPFAAGDGYRLTLNHELGHSFGLPHLGEITGTAASAEDVAKDNVFPYTGDFAGGAFGATWAYDPEGGVLVPPTCPSGKEMQDPMQRRDTCVGEGKTYDHFSDYSALRILRYFSGASGMRGEVSYRGGRVPFAFPEVPGREVLTDAPAGPTFQRWDRASASYVPTDATADIGFASSHPVSKGPAYLVYGTFNFSSDTTSTIYEPLLYRGFHLRNVDLTKQAELAALRSAGPAAAGIENGADLTLRAEYDDGTVRHFLLKNAVRGESLSNPTSAYGFRTFAVNVPADHKLVKATLLFRRIALRAPSDAFEGNLARETAITSANVYAGARVAATWQAP